MREVAILVTGAQFRSAYEIYAHVLVAEARGLPDDKIATIVAGQRPSDLSREEAVAYDVTAALVSGTTAGTDLPPGCDTLQREWHGRADQPDRPLLRSLRYPEWVRRARPGRYAKLMGFSAGRLTRARLMVWGPCSLPSHCGSSGRSTGGTELRLRDRLPAFAPAFLCQLPEVLLVFRDMGDRSYRILSPGDDHGVVTNPRLVATIQRLPHNTIESTLPSPGTMSPWTTFQVP